MKAEALHAAVLAALGELPGRVPEIISLTLAGSFAAARSLEGISDIDTIVVLRELRPEVIEALQREARTVLEPLLAEAGYALRINWSLGPLKYNDPQTAVLHLMTYTAEGHRQHVLHSPFTCLDWQRAEQSWGRTLKEVYPVFALQPHHFLSARRGVQDYARDLLNGEVSYREFVFEGETCREVPRAKPMTARDRHEFAYHVLRFMMANFLKLIRRENAAAAEGALAGDYFAEFPLEAGRLQVFFADLERRKRNLEFDLASAALIEGTLGFLQAFELQFRHAFEREAACQVWTRHAPTGLNMRTGTQTVFQGSGTDAPILEPKPETSEPLREAVRKLAPATGWSSPSQRARATLQGIIDGKGAGLSLREDARLGEMNYGACEGLTVEQARQKHTDLFAAWERGEDPRFPAGENTADVLGRLQSFLAAHARAEDGPQLFVTHNALLRCLVGSLMRVPIVDWWRIRIAHIQPLMVVATRRYGLFMDLDAACEGSMFENFMLKGDAAA